MSDDTTIAFVDPTFAETLTDRVRSGSSGKPYKLSWTRFLKRMKKPGSD